ncbi:Mitochondrial oxaloacetate carrier protein [Microbotryomycetes sp. JL221]|nr:Mitochondrial oxaloacetate carrier protein [Microbotryomycetes sp. JL221]
MPGNTQPKLTATEGELSNSFWGSVKPAAEVQRSSSPWFFCLTTGFISGALAACTAVTVTNPAEVAKTRLQLDGELQGRKGVILPSTTAPAGTAAIKLGPTEANATASHVDTANASNSSTARPRPQSGRVYTGPIDCLKKTYRFEGVRGIQRGLGAAYAYQIALNGSRLGFYEPIRHRLNALAGLQATDLRVWSSLTAGASSGIIGAIFGNPLFLVKARMQAYSPFNPVGAQHNYKSTLHAFQSIVQQEGLRGLARGVDAAMLRTAMGSSVQLPTYNLAKSYLGAWGVHEGIAQFLMASLFSGLCVCAVMQPADKNPIDCLYKTWKTEGVRGWYKGTTAHLARIAPHTIITLTANDFYSRRYMAWKTVQRHD